MRGSRAHVACENRKKTAVWFAENDLGGSPEISEKKPEESPILMNIPIISGSVPRAQKVCVYGPEGVGKTTFGAQFPKPLFLDLERGSCA